MTEQTDRFGNPVDASVGFARGPVIASREDEVRRMLHGRRLIRSRIAAQGIDSLYNLSGVTRTLPLSTEDLDRLRTQIHFYGYFEGDLEPIAIRYAGGVEERHGACLATRVTAAMLATALTLFEADDEVLSIVPRGVSHPSIPNAAQVAGARFTETRGIDEALQALETPVPAGRTRYVVVTAITPQKFCFEEAELATVIARARSQGFTVIVDDAHAAVRTAHFGQKPVLELDEVDVALISLDKHMDGPRAGLIVGQAATVDRIKSRMYQLGIEAPFANYAAGIRAIEGYSPSDIREAGLVASKLMERLEADLDCDEFYTAGAGVAISEDTLTDLTIRRMGERRPALVPVEISSLVAMRLVASSGFMTVLAVGMPGSSAAFRLTMYPDGARAGVDAIVEAVDDALEFAAAHADDVDFVRDYVCPGR